MNTAMTKQYIPVMVQFTPDGRMMPRKLHWIDDEIYRIDRVKQIRPASASKTGGLDDRYTVMINGRESYIYFEHNPEYGARRIGRWYVEVPAHEEYEQ